MRANHMCCKKVEIFCPCSEDELESIVNFLYCGSISFTEEEGIATTLRNLTNIFGFPEKLFSTENPLILKQGNVNNFSECNFISILNSYTY